MTPQQLITKKRDGKRLSAADIRAFVEGVSRNTWADYQTTALVMAMFINGLDQSEQTALTRSMLDSGEVLDFSDIDAPKADKHSTGGVGDKTSLIIAPLAAACGLAVPMISGRGLGHTGGTLDKLESIDGYHVRLTKSEIYDTIKSCGFAMAGQTMKIVPADRKLYALRDAAAMVESVPLIVASIMSKKLAEGLDALVLDVKTGSGAFMKTLKDARGLARALVRTGNEFGVRTEALITSMDQPLGRFVGNANEVYECIRILRNEGDELMRPTRELSVDLTARMLVLSGLAKSEKVARAMCISRLEDGSALEKFRENISLQQGDPRVCDKPKELLKTKLKRVSIKAESAGYVGAIDTRTVGECVCAVGGGRVLASDSVDHAVGFECLVPVGSRVSRGDTLGILSVREAKGAAAIGTKLLGAYKITREKPAKTALVREVIR
jgi:pyrimidine-nucleoside phosphorylase